MKLLLVALEMGISGMFFNKDNGSEVKQHRCLIDHCPLKHIAHIVCVPLLKPQDQHFCDLPGPSLSRVLGFTKDGFTTSNHQKSSAMNTRKLFCGNK